MQMQSLVMDMQLQELVQWCVLDTLCYDGTARVIFKKENDTLTWIIFWHQRLLTQHCFAY